jgi:hypothetical protein
MRSDRLQRFVVIREEYMNKSRLELVQMMRVQQSNANHTDGVRENSDENATDTGH